MRFDTPIFFVREDAGTYNPHTGDYENGDKGSNYKLADVTDSSETTMNLVYGKIKQGAKTVRIQGEKPKAFDYIKIGTKSYRVDWSRQLRRLATFVVSEVQT